MPNDLQPTAEASPALDELERRMNAFDAAARRLSDKVGKNGQTVEPVRTASPPHPPADVPGASGLAPRVHDDGSPAEFIPPVQRRDAIHVMAVPHQHLTMPPHGPWGWTWWRQRKLLVPAACVLVALWLLSYATKPIPELAGGEVGAPARQILAPVNGTVEKVAVRIGDRVPEGATLLSLDSRDIAAPVTGIVVRLLVAPGARIALGEPLVEIADSSAVRVRLPLYGAPLGVGEPVRVRLLGEDRRVPGTVERIEDAALGPAPRIAVIAIDPRVTAPKLGQGARVAPLGSVGVLRRITDSLREVVR